MSKRRCRQNGINVVDWQYEPLEIWQSWEGSSMKQRYLVETEAQENKGLNSQPHVTVDFFLFIVTQVQEVQSWQAWNNTVNFRLHHSQLFHDVISHILSAQLLPSNAAASISDIWFLLSWTCLHLKYPAEKSPALISVIMLLIRLILVAVVGMSSGISVWPSAMLDQGSLYPPPSTQCQKWEKSCK